MHRTTLTKTLVLLITTSVFSTSAWAIKTAPSPDETPAEKKESQASSEELARAKQVNLTPAPPVSERVIAEEYFYSHRHAVSFLGGMTVATNDFANMDSVLSLVYWFPLRNLTGAEAGADLASDGTGILQLAARQTFGQGRFRRFIRIGGGVRIQPSDQLVTFIRRKNWQGRIGAGIEYVVSDPFSFRIGADGIATTENTAVAATAGLTWAW